MPKWLLCLYPDSLLHFKIHISTFLYYRIENAVSESFQCNAYLIFLEYLYFMSPFHIFKREKNEYFEDKTYT